MYLHNLNFLYFILFLPFYPHFFLIGEIFDYRQIEGKKFNKWIVENFFLKSDDWWNILIFPL